MAGYYGARSQQPLVTVLQPQLVQTQMPQTTTNVLPRPACSFGQRPAPMPTYAQQRPTITVLQPSWQMPSPPQEKSGWCGGPCGRQETVAAPAMPYYPTYATSTRPVSVSYSQPAYGQYTQANPYQYYAGPPQAESSCGGCCPLTGYRR